MMCIPLSINLFDCKIKNDKLKTFLLQNGSRSDFTHDAWHIELIQKKNTVNWPFYSCHL